jgi:hypothetical protein
MNQSIYNNAVEFVTKTLSDIRPFLDVETFNAINHYITHSEIEMAFEVMFLEVINQNLAIRIDSGTAIRTAKELSLDKETVFDVDFWSKFTNFIENQKR